MPTSSGRTYAVELADGRITGLVEKPDTVPKPYLGCGTYLFSPDIFRDGPTRPHARRAPDGSSSPTSSITRPAAARRCSRSCSPATT